MLLEHHGNTITNELKTIYEKEVYYFESNKPLFELWYHQESNRGHKDFQSFALPTELWYHCFLIAFAKVMLFYLSAKLFANNLFNVLKKSVSLWYNWGFVAQIYFFFSLIGM